MQILRNPDGDNSGLDFNIADQDTSRPRLPAAVYEFEVANPQVEPTKDRKGQLLAMQLKTTKDNPAITGEVIKTGFTLYHRISLTPTPKYTIENIRRNLASFFKAAGMSGSAKAILSQPAMLVGKKVQAKVSVRAETEQYPESNEIQYFIEPK